MPHNQKDVFEAIFNWLNSHSTVLYGVVLAMITSFLRITYDKIGGSQRFVESVLCGAIALAVSEGLDYFGVPNSLSPFVGGMIGFFGIEKIREIGNSFINKRIDTKKDDKDDK